MVFKRPTRRDVCGSEAGWSAHRRAMEYSCILCSDAHSDRTRANKILSGTQASILVPAKALSRILNNSPETEWIMEETFGPEIMRAIREISNEQTS